MSEFRECFFIFFAFIRVKKNETNCSPFIASGKGHEFEDIMKGVMNIKPIRTEEDYENALKEIERLFDAEAGTPEEDKLEVLSILVDVYESEHYAIPLPDPIEAIEYHAERLKLSRKDLAEHIGSASRVSEILNRKRRLTMKMIRNLNAALDIPLEILTQDYELEGQKREKNRVNLFGRELVNV